MSFHDRIKFSPYAPVRNQNAFWWTYALEAARAGWVLNDGRVAAHLMDKIQDELVVPALEIGMKHLEQEIPDPGERSQALGASYAKLAELRHWVPLTAQFLNCGRQIFDLTDDVVEMLENTDFGDCTLEGWHPPYEAFFVHFGKRDAIRIPFGDDFEYLDGAFVARTPYDEQGNMRLKLGFSTCKKSGEGVMTPGYFLDFTPVEQTMPVALAIEHAIARRDSAFLDQPDDSETVKALNAHMRSEIEDAGEILKLASGLIVNVLFYLESLGDQRRLEPGRDAPTDYTVRWEQSNPRQREKLKSKLLSEGYTAVYLLGREFTSTKAAPHGGHRRTHWRRGHWRDQHHGKANSLIKRKWIKPQLIGASSADDLTGHVYVVGNAETPDTKH
ncbi:hypothetical protein ABH908_000320 [Pseudomonas frederiksbergensis]|uniref:hypothetical protein n=1 Tax=Pseudomonas TaxID=286 RepID=UPI003D2309D0